MLGKVFGIKNELTATGRGSWHGKEGQLTWYPYSKIFNTSMGQKKKRSIVTSAENQGSYEHKCKVCWCCENSIRKVSNTVFFVDSSVGIQRSKCRCDRAKQIRSRNNNQIVR